MALSDDAKSALYDLFPEELESLKIKSSEELWELIQPKVEETLLELSENVEEHLEYLNQRIEGIDFEEGLKPLAERLEKVEKLHDSLASLERGLERHRSATREQIESSSKASREIAYQALGRLNELGDRFPDLSNDIRRAHTRLDNLPEEYDDQNVWEELKELRKMLLKTGQGGGNANRNIWVNGNSSVLSRYGNINLIPGTGINITYVNNDTNKTTDITITSPEGAGINPQTPVGSVNGINVTFTCTGLVKVAMEDNGVDSVASITGAVNSTITYSVPPQNNVFAF